MNNIHDDLERVRKPRIHIKYEVETEGVPIQRELPFVVGVMGDFSGNAPGKEIKNLRDRKFVKIDRDNFDNVMENINPGINLQVENKLLNDGSMLNFTLQFSCMDDFSPAQLVEKIEPLRKLKQVRDQLRDLLIHADRSSHLEDVLENLLQNSQQLQQLSKQLDIEWNEPHSINK